MQKDKVGEHVYLPSQMELRYPRRSAAEWREQRRRRVQSTVDRANHVVHRAMEPDPDFVGVNALLPAAKRTERFKIMKSKRVR